MGKHTFEVNDDNFQQEVLAADKPVLIDFWAEWCGPCKALAPIVDQIAGEFEGKLRVGKFDVDVNNVHMDYDVQGIPTLILFKDGAEIHRFVGYRTHAKLKAELEKFVETEKA